MPDGTKLLETQEALDRDNDVRRSTIRRIFEEIRRYQDKIHDAELRYLELNGDYPPRDFAAGLRVEIDRLRDEARALAYDIVSLEAGPGYLIVRCVEPWEYRRVLEAL